MEGNFTEESRSLLISAKEEMYKLKHSYVGTEHLLLAILKSNLKNRLNKYNITYEIALKNIKKIVGVGTKETDLFLYTPVLKRIIENSIIDSKDNNTDVTPEILFLNFLEEGEGVGIRILLISNIDLDKLYLEFKDNYKNKKNKNNEIINELGCNLNELNIDPVIGREKEINRIIEILSRRSKNNPILIGEAGVGKTAIVEELSKRIKEGKVPSKLLGKKIIKVDMASVVAGTKYRGEFEEKIKKLINAVSDDHNIILFIDEIHTIVGAGGAEGAIDASNILKPALARNEISLIGATTISEYKKFICEDKALERRFQKVIIDEPNTVETINIITNLVPIYEKFHNVKINKKDIENIVKLSNKYIKDRHEPDASIDILDEVCSRVSLKESKKDLEYKKIVNEYNKINLQKKELIKKEKYEEALKIKEIEKYYLDKINTLELYRKKDVNKVTINDIANVIKDKCNLPIYEILGFNIDNISSCFYSYDLIQFKQEYNKEYSYIANILIRNEKFSELQLEENLFTKEGEKMKFDIVVGNPPYQLEGGSGGNNDAPIYQEFFEVSRKLNPKYISMIIKAGWFSAGRENLLSDFRTEMLSSNKVEKLVVYPDSSEVFENVTIAGGLCYFVYNNSYNGECNYKLIQNNKVKECTRNLNDFDILIREYELSSIVKKVQEKNQNQKWADEIISNDTPFGISSNLKMNKNETIKITKQKEKESDIRICYIQNRKRTSGYIDRNIITKHKEDIDKYNVFLPGGFGGGDAYYHKIIGTPEYGGLSSVCSQSYLYASFDTEIEAINFMKYIATKFLRVLVSAIKITQSAPSKVYRFVPVLDFSENSNIDWSKSIDEIDNQLYIIYSLSKEEIEYINNKVKDFNAE